MVTYFGVLDGGKVGCDDYSVLDCFSSHLLPCLLIIRIAEDYGSDILHEFG